MSPPGCQKMWAKPCNQNAEESFPVHSLKSQAQKPPNPLLIQDKNILQPSTEDTREQCARRGLGPSVGLPDEPLLLCRSRAIMREHPPPQYAATKVGRHAGVFAMLDFSRDRMHEDRSPISRTRKRHAGHAARGERCHEGEQEQEDA